MQWNENEILKLKGETTILWHHVTPTQSRLKLIVPLLLGGDYSHIPHYPPWLQNCLFCQVVCEDFPTRWAAHAVPTLEPLVWVVHKMLKNNAIASNIVSNDTENKGFLHENNKKGFLNKIKITFNSLLIVHCYRC